MQRKIKIGYYDNNNTQICLEDIKYKLKLVYITDNLEDIINLDAYFFSQYNVKVKKCENCSKYFIVKSRADEKYCDNISPQDPEKMCFEYAPQAEYKKKLRSNEMLKLARNYDNKLRLFVSRHPDDLYAQTRLKNFRTQNKKWKDDVKKGIKTEKEYLVWLKSFK